MASMARPDAAMAAPTSAAEVKAAIADYLRYKGLPPTQAWLNGLMPSIRVNAPIFGLQKTALFRLLSTDITKSVQASQAPALPSGISSPDVKETRIAGAVALQVLDVEDIGHSRWSQVEDVEAQERGETTKGREVIRVVQDDTNSDPNHTPGAAASTVPHKLLLQDVAGTKVYACELRGVSGISVSMAIGSKLLLRNATVARGMIMLDERNVEVLGGKIEVWDKNWRAQRKFTLKRAAGMTEAE